MRLPGPLSEYHRRHPEVTLELRTGNPRELATPCSRASWTPRRGGADRRRPFEKLLAFEEELVIVAGQETSADRRGRRAPAKIVAFEEGCPHRKRLEDWFARQGAMPERTVELSSYHAMLGCVVAGMGISLVPQIVLETFPGAKLLSIHPLSARPQHRRYGLHQDARARSLPRSARCSKCSCNNPMSKRGQPGRPRKKAA